MSNYMDCLDADATYGGIFSAVVELNGVTSVYDCEGYRLPTEAEWEYAYRAGSNTAFYPTEGNDGTITTADMYPLDPNLAQIAWYSGNSQASYPGAFDCSSWYAGATTCGPQPVGGKAMNRWGLFDMSGNVYEWMWDGDLVELGEDPATDPEGPNPPGDRRVIRGGSWGELAGGCRGGYRYRERLTQRNNYIGFRAAKTAP